MEHNLAMTCQEVLMQPITIGELVNLDPYEEGLDILLTRLGKTQEDVEFPITLLDVLESHDKDDGRHGSAFWFLTFAIPNADRERRLFSCWSARQTLHLTADKRCTTAINVATKYAFNEASKKELSSAQYNTPLILDETAEYMAFCAASATVIRTAWVTSWVLIFNTPWDVASYYLYCCATEPGYMERDAREWLALVEKKRVEEYNRERQKVSDQQEYLRLKKKFRGT